MAGRYENRNRSVIRKAFGRLPKSKDAMIEAGLSNLLREAMTYAVTNHDHHHFAHRILADSYGWAVVHNGIIRNLQVNGGRHGRGTAEEQLRRVARNVSTEGWVGILLSSMVAEYGRRKPIYFEVDYEMDILHATIEEVSNDFSRYFRPIAV